MGFKGKEKNIDKNTNKKGPFKIILSIIGWALFGIICTIFVMNQIDLRNGYQTSIFGYRASIVVSESMSRVDASNQERLKDIDVLSIQINDLIITKNYDSFEEIQVNEILTYLRSDGQLVCHRVIDTYESDGYNYVVTQGDANTQPDFPVQYEAVRGQVIKVIPKVGGVVRFLRSGFGLGGICFTVFFICLGSYISKQDDKKSGNIKNEK